MATPEREEIAKRYGFDSFADLLDLSDPLTQVPGDRNRAYIARGKDGLWFVWEDVPPGLTLGNPRHSSER